MALFPRQRFHEFLSPAGAGIVIICFFLPWLRVSCGAKKITLAGSDLGGVFYVVLGAAVLMLTAFVALTIIGRSGLSRLICLSGSVIALGIIVYKSIQVALDPEIPFYIPERMIGFELKTGAIGTIAGLILALAGTFIWGRREKPGNSGENSDG